MNEAEGVRLLGRGLNLFERKLDARLIGELAHAFVGWCKERDSFGTSGNGQPRTETTLTLELLQFLQAEIEAEAHRILALRERHGEFTKRLAHAGSVEERQQHILQLARDLGASGWHLQGDRAALARWFGADAVSERYARRQACSERKITFCLRQLGSLAAWVLERGAEEVPPEEQWRRLGLEKAVQPLLIYDGDTRVAAAAFRCLATAMQATSEEIQETLVDDSTLSFIYRSALDARQNLWIQCEAITLLRSLSRSALQKVLELRLSQPEEGDDLFVRRRAVRLLGTNWKDLPELAKLIPVVMRDPSPYVRQGLARALVTAPPNDACAWLWRLAREDPVPQVRAAAVYEGLGLLQRPGCESGFLTLLTDVMSAEADSFVLRVACHVAEEGTYLLSREGPESPDPAMSFLALWAGRTREALDTLHRQASDLAVRRWAAQARERIWCETDPAARAFRETLRRELADLRPGQSRRLARSLFPKDEDLIGRVLSVLALDDFGYDLEWRWWGVKVTRGTVWRFRLWRLLHEFRYPDPAKRQAFRHTIGRVSHADLRAPSAILAELAQTKVPGEPLFLSSEAGWRPYLPLLDDVLSCLSRGLLARPVRIWTSDGVTEVIPPASVVRRIWAYLRISWSFAHIARLRNWQEEGPTDPSAYLRTLTELGLRFRFRPHGGEAAEVAEPDPAIQRFFPRAAFGMRKEELLGLPPSAVLLLSFPEVQQWLWELAISFWFYFSSVYVNSVSDLVIFVVLAVGVFFGRHWFVNQQLKRARRRLSLVIGGWGTRGKSGTERLKAALVNALGYGLISKTTGCEAMFLHAYPYSRLREMYLHRSYDKATIWEQADVVRIAGELKTEVFLWECMGLNPAYVKVLQQDWMRDDIATLTNTYPDHEDIQGPAGVNIPEVMTNFIPPQSRLLTSEEQMSPILLEAAGRKGTTFRNVGWLEAGMLTSDVLQRFPYEEHPYNIALALSFADELGVDRDYALKEMADRVVPDLGVLRTSPPARLRTRRLEFSNGMSANERHGCLNNWQRLGFDRQDPEREPGVWITTVVNNRADRIPRSRVFASVLVHDLSADRHFLIGGNLQGLEQYIREAWAEFIPTITLWPDMGPDLGSEKEPPIPDPQSPISSPTTLALLESLARRFRQPYREKIIRNRLRAMLDGLAAYCPGLTPARVSSVLTSWHDPAQVREDLTQAGVDLKLVDGVVRCLAEDLLAWQEYQDLAARVGRVAGGGWRAAGEGIADSSSDPQSPIPHPKSAIPPPAIRAALDAELRELLGKWFRRKFVVIENYHATGDQIIDRICEETPPGFRNRIMGIQNIKGTGLDFVYRWQAWIACYQACTLLRSPDMNQVERGLRELASFQDFGLLCEEHMRETLEVVQPRVIDQREEFQAYLRMIATNFETAMRAVRTQLGRQGPTSQGWLAWIVGIVEAFLDAGDAVRRRKRANRIYQDLATERISHERAALELELVNKREEGGWLLAMLTRGR